MTPPFGNKYGIEPNTTGVHAANEYLAKRKVEKQIFANDRSLLFGGCLCVGVMLLILVLGA